MKTLLEEIVSLSKHREAKQAETKQRADNSAREALVRIDLSVAAAIDDLKQQGLEEYNAYRIVMNHLSDIVMAHDIGDTE